MNRAEEAINFVGGKGQNYTVACEQLQKADKVKLEIYKYIYIY